MPSVPGSLVDRLPRSICSFVIDGLGGPGSLSAEPDAPFTDAHINDVRASGLTCAHTTILPVGSTPPDTAYAGAVRGILWYEREIDSNSQTLMRIRTVADIRQAKRSSRTGIIYGFQDGVMFETDLSRLDDFHRLGVRVIQPTYNRRNLLGDGCLEPANAGLSKAGVAAVERMNDLGILVDLSHCGRRTAADAIRVSRRPVAFTHTGSAAVADHPRNRSRMRSRRPRANARLPGSPPRRKPRTVIYSLRISTCRVDSKCWPAC
jgi:membrane dipeptidase